MYGWFSFAGGPCLSESTISPTHTWDLGAWRPEKSVWPVMPVCGVPCLPCLPLPFMIVSRKEAWVMGNKWHLRCSSCLLATIWMYMWLPCLLCLLSGEALCLWPSNNQWVGWRERSFPVLHSPGGGSLVAGDINPIMKRRQKTCICVYGYGERHGIR